MAIGLGLASALALATRPIEAACLLLPIAVHLGLLVRRGELERGAAALAAGLTALGPLALWVYQHRLEGVPFGDGGGSLAAGGAYVLLLVFYFAGPLVLPLLAFAGWRGGEVVAVAAGGLFLLLVKPLLAAGDQAHVLGPQGGTAAALPLLILAVEGVSELARRCAAAGLSWLPFAAAGLGWLAALLLFLPFQGQALLARTDLLRALGRQSATPAPAIVLVEPLKALLSLEPALLVQDAWRGELPHPDPWLRDRVTFADATAADPVKLRRAFPKRALYLLRVQGGAEVYRLEPLP